MTTLVVSPLSIDNLDAADWSVCATGLRWWFTVLLPIINRAVLSLKIGKGMAFDEKIAKIWKDN